MREHPIKLFLILTVCVAGLELLLTTCFDRGDLLKLAGHDRATLMRSNTPQRQESFVWQCAESLKQGRYDELLKRFSSGFVGAETRKALIAVHDSLTDREPVSVKVIDAQRYREGDMQITDIVLDYEFPSVAKRGSQGSTEVLPAKWVFVTYRIRSTSLGVDSVAGINALISEQPIEAIHAFTFKNKGLSQYAAFAAATLLNTFAIYAAVLCVTAKIGPKKWMWIVLMLFTFIPVSVNWTTGDWSFNALSVGFKVPPLPAHGVCSAYGPITLQLGLPIAAIAFVLCRKRLEGNGSATAVALGVLDDKSAIAHLQVQ